MQLRKNKEKEASANIIVSSSTYVDSLEVDDSTTREVLTISVHYEEDSWILDLGDTFHIFLHKTLFVEYRKMSETVYLGDMDRCL